MSVKPLSSFIGGQPQPAQLGAEDSGDCVESVHVAKPRLDTPQGRLLRKEIKKVQGIELQRQRPVVQSKRTSERALFEEELPRVARTLPFSTLRKLFLRAVRCLVDAARDSPGGAGYVCTLRSSYDFLSASGVVFSVTDSSETFSSGYMSHLLKGVHLDKPGHQNALRKFAEHTANDRWPKGHPAEDLSKDGYNLYDASGVCCLAAARLEGLPAAPCQWVNAGMRHTTALQLCWALALKGRSAVAIVSSDSGRLHVLCACDGAVEVHCLREA